MRRRKSSDGWFCKDRAPCDARVAANANYEEYEIRTRKIRGRDEVEISYRPNGSSRFRRFLVPLRISRNVIEEQAVQLVRQHATTGHAVPDSGHLT
jgi:hypothetical protein